MNLKRDIQRMITKKLRKPTIEKMFKKLVENEIKRVSQLNEIIADFKS